MCTEARRRRHGALVALAAGLAPLVAAAAEPVAPAPAAAVRSTELAFARTMADRDLEAFRDFLSPEAVFFSGERVLRGADAVTEAWASYFEAPEAPFSWRPEAVEVLDSGALALSSGPVFDPAGRRVGTFNSVWRRDDSGAWKIVFDKGEKTCPE